jgi:soluble lytic murein transglycosylase
MSDAPPAARTPQAQAPPVAASPTPAPPPAPELLERALQARAVGDYDRSAEDLHNLIEIYADAPEARPARYYLAESYGRRDRWTSAVEALRAFLAEDAAQDALSAQAQFWLARGYESAGDWANAVAAYQDYRALGTPLEPYAAMRQAAQHQAQGQLAEAAVAYEHAAATDIAGGERSGSLEKAIALWRQLGRPEAALALYEQRLALEELPGERARLLFDAAALAGELGQAERARAGLREILDIAPQSAQAADALLLLLAEPAPDAPSPAQAARILFDAGRYDAALPQFDAAIAAAGGDEALELRRLRAMALREQGDMQGALDELAAVGAAAPNSEPGRQAQLDWVQTLGQSGQTEQAIAGYRQFAEAYGGPAVAAPDSRVPEALARAAELLERLGDLEAALQQRVDLARRFPQSEQALGLFYGAGLQLYRGGRDAEAQAAWLAPLDAAPWPPEPYEHVRAAYWAGLAAQRQGDAQQAGALWRRAQQALPSSYYGARAAEQLLAHGPSAPLSATEAISAPVALEAPIVEGEWRELELWAAAITGQPAYHVGERGFSPEVAQAGWLVRAQALAEGGLHVESLAEWNDARVAWRQDAQRLLQLARLAHERGAPSVALRAAADLQALAPPGAPPTPRALLRLLYPTPYAPLVTANAREQAVDPLLVYALLRQESLFDPGGVSSAGATGLAQIMPGTGQGIAQRLGMQGFEPAWLTRPAVSVRFGTFYIAQQIKAMEGNIHAGLAAYNGGPGNAARWIEASGLADLDLFTESIDYGETRNYVKIVYANYTIYRRLYATREQGAQTGQSRS